MSKGWKYYLLLSVLLTIGACSGAKENVQQKAAAGSIAVLLPDSSSSMRWEADDRRFFEQAFEAAGIEYIVFNAEGSAQTQQTQAEQAITPNPINNGQNDIPFMKLTPIVVTKDNIAETVIADGFRTWDEICIGEFEQYCPPPEER